MSTHVTVDCEVSNSVSMVGRTGTVIDCISAKDPTATARMKKVSWYGVRRAVSTVRRCLSLEGAVVR